MKLTFFHQKRKDLRTRTGIEVDDDLLLEKLSPGFDGNDSALLWYVDVRCTGEQPAPTEPPEARALLINMGEPVRSAFLILAEELRAGLDSDVWPIRRRISNLPSGLSGEVVCSAMRRITDGELSHVLRNLAENWPKVLEELSEPAVLAQ
jgi:hypothetical protein